MNNRVSLLVSAAMAISFATGISNASTIFTSSFDNGTGFVITESGDTEHQFGYDYSADGIPEAPNSVGGAPTTGLRVAANVENPTGAEEIAAVTNGLGLSGRYRISVDMWANREIPSGSSTEFMGAGVGHDGTTAGRNGASLIASGDGGSSYDYRLYKDTGLQFPGSFQYNSAFGTEDPGANNNTNPVIATAFPGQSAPAAQGQAATANADGTVGFQWMTLVIDVDSDAIGSGVTSDPGTATFTLTSDASGETLLIGTIDNSNGGGAVNMTGDVALLYADLFSSVNTSGFQFGVFDNFSAVAIPEPTSITLICGMAALAVFGFRRRVS